MNVLRSLSLVLVLVSVALPVSPLCSVGASSPLDYDLVVYGGTAAGAATAIEAGRHGLRVVLLEPGHHIGGMLTGGLSATDIGNPNVIGGISREFFLRAAQQYHLSDLKTSSDWRFEPHVGEEILLRMLREAHVQVELGEKLQEQHGVLKENGRIAGLRSSDGRIWRGKIFADCSYEGDVMTQAGVSYTWGREPTSEYGESLAGVQARTPHHQFTFPVSSYDAHDKLLPEIDPGPLAAPGTGDRKIQAYNFRVILTQNAADMLPFPKPEGYDAHQFALLARYFKEFEKKNGRSPRLNEVTLPMKIPNDKADFNNDGPFSTDYIGRSWSYPQAGYAERQRIWKDHLRYTEGFFYFLANNPAVPSDLQREMRSWGLPKDEFRDTEHWPFQLYVREARRMIGAYVMVQQDLQTQRTKPDPIGMGSYNSDSHNVQRISTPDGHVENEGNVEVPVSPYQIPYRSIVPKHSEVQNLLVPVCFSATHVAYSSMRMEPQYMILGQAAGLAAYLAVQQQQDVQSIDTKKLQVILQEEKAVLSLSQQ